MVAERVARPEALELLYEPDRPKRDQRATHGWVRKQGIRDRIEWIGLERAHEDDKRGAIVQHGIARYILCGVHRSVLAAEIGISDRQCQAYLSGVAWGAYGRPVLRALKRLGIGGDRGDRWRGGRRLHEIIAAQQAVLRRAEAALLAPNLPLYDRDQILADIRLLALASDGAS